MPFLTSLTHTGTKVGGQEQRDTQMLEACVPRFPHDYPTTEPYRERAEAWGVSKKNQWERTPPAKRVNYKHLGIDNPWKADWENVLGRSTSGLVGHVPTQRDTVRPWLLNKYLAPAILSGTADVSDPAAWLFGELNALQLARGNTGLSPEASANGLWHHALVQVQVELLGRGTFGDVAAIYLLRDDELRVCDPPLEGLLEVRFACWLAETITNVHSPLNFSILPKK